MAVLDYKNPSTIRARRWRWPSGWYIVAFTVLAMCDFFVSMSIAPWVEFQKALRGQSDYWISYGPDGQVRPTPRTMRREYPMSYVAAKLDIDIGNSDEFLFVATTNALIFASCLVGAWYALSVILPRNLTRTKDRISKSVRDR